MPTRSASAASAPAAADGPAGHAAREPAPRVLVVDDEPHVLKTLALALERFGAEVDAFARPHDALAAATPGRYDLAFVDLMMEPVDGLVVLKDLHRRVPETTAVLMTAHSSVETAVRAMREGAYDYLEKPFDLAALHAFYVRMLAHHRLRHEVVALRARLARQPGGFGGIVTEDAALREVLDLAVAVADSSLSVLIEGESGTGKEGVAQLVHERSPRAAGPFVRVNCAALPEHLIESELFGHARGAFTGAVADRVGRFEAADGGTIFLDEVGELPLPVQAKLLRVLQQKEFERVGESRTRRVDVRVVAATNQNLDAAQKEKAFREDLFYRIAGVRLSLPPLRDRPGDVPLLVAHFAAHARPGAAAPVFSAEAMGLLRAYRWPGNVRELINVVERAVVLARGGRVEAHHLPAEMRDASAGAAVLETLEAVEHAHIRRVLGVAKDQAEAARILGIDPTTLWRKRKRMGL